MFSGTLPNTDIGLTPRGPKKTYIRVPTPETHVCLQRLSRALAGAVLSPLYWILARVYRGPGLRFRLRCAVLGLHLFGQRKSHLSYSDFYKLFFGPIDSVRYFGVHFMWEAPSKLRFHNYLDVSSPRLFPVILLREHPPITAELVNPDNADLQATEILVTACDLNNRCHLRNGLIEDVPFVPESFDAVTLISVVQHIHDDKNAIKSIWGLLKPGCRLLLSVPCCSVAEQEFVDVDFFGLQTPDEHGFFHQYRYNYALLQERIFSITGSPQETAMYGERKRGTLLNGLLRKWAGHNYPMWKEPYAMAREFRYYESISDLPGEGVIAMEFVKK